MDKLIEQLKRQQTRACKRKEFWHEKMLDFDDAGDVEKKNVARTRWHLMITQEEDLCRMIAGAKRMQQECYGELDAEKEAGLFKGASLAESMALLSGGATA